MTTVMRCSQAGNTNVGTHAPPKQAEDLSTLEPEGHVVDGNERPEGLPEGGRVQH
jgi:hypothetical protein